MAKINTNFLLTGASWSLLEVQNLQYSFEDSLPLYFGLNPPLNFAHNLKFKLGTVSEFTVNSDPNFIDQQDITRFILDDPSKLSTYTGEQTVNTTLVNSVDYRVSFSEVIDASFSESQNGTGDLAIMNQEAYSASDPSLAYIPDGLAKAQGNAGDVFINSLHTENFTELKPGEEGFWVILHELGHAVGGLEDVSDTTEAGTFVDSQKYTMMSYNPYGSFDNNGDVFVGTEVYTHGLQLLDIAALQDTYSSVNTTTRADDTTYALGQGLGFAGADADDAFLYTIWDGGGNDTIDASGFSSLGFGVQIDLREGHFSSIGVDSAGNFWNWDDSASSFDPDPGNVAIAYGTEIENAVGTAHDDYLIGNDLDNTFFGAAGDDEIHGNAGSDTADYSGVSNGESFYINLSSLNQAYVDTGAAGDTFYGVEDITGTSGNDRFVIGGGNDGFAGYYMPCPANDNAVPCNYIQKVA